MLGDGRHQVGDRAEHVELDLAVGGVADADRPRPGVAGQGVDDRLGAQLVAVHGVQGVQPLRVTAGVVDHPHRPRRTAGRPPRSNPGRPGPGRSSRRRAASSTGSPSCGRRRSPRAATRSRRPGSRRSARGTARAGSTRCARTTSRATDGSRSDAVQSCERCSVTSCRLATPIGLASTLEVPSRSSRTAVPPIADRSIVARATSLPPSPTMSQSTPGECSAIGSLEPSTSRPSPSGCNRIGSWPNSGRGANSTLARAVPDRLRIRAVPWLSDISNEPPLTVCRSSQSVIGQARPAGLHGHGARQVALPERQAAALQGDREVAGGGPAEQVGEQRGGVRSGVAQPAHPGLRGDQRDGAAVGQHRVPLDRHRPLAEQPLPAVVQQRAEQAYASTGPETRWWATVSPSPTLTPRSGPWSWANAFSSVTSSPKNTTALAAICIRSASTADALVGGDHRQFDDLLAAGRVDPRPGRRPGADRLQDQVGDLGPGAPRVDGHARRLDLQPDPLAAADQRRQRLDQLVRNCCRSGARASTKPDVELGAVAADQMDLAGQPGQRGEVAQRPPGDHRDRRLRQAGQRP